MDDLARGRGDARVVHEYVDGTKSLYRLVRDRRYRRGVPDVQRTHQHASASLLALSGGLVKLAYRAKMVGDTRHVSGHVGED